MIQLLVYCNAREDSATLLIDFKLNRIGEAPINHRMGERFPVINVPSIS